MELAARSRSASHRSARNWLGAAAFALGGAALLGWLIHRGDPARLWHVLIEAAPWLPVILAIEGVRITTEAWGSRRLYEHRIPFPALWRATVVAYAVAALAPGGRATGEGVKAGMLRKSTGLADTAAAATTIQTCSLVALGAWSVVCAVVALGVSLPLAGALVLQTAIAAAGAALVRGASHTSVLGRLLARIAPRARGAVESLRAHAEAQHLREPLVALLASRGLELVEYAVIFAVVVRRFAAVPATLAFGVATVAGTLGDSVPVQLGVSDASFSAAAHALAISSEDALAIALVAHACQLAWVAIALVIPLVWRGDRAD